MNSTNFSSIASKVICFLSILPDDEYAVADYFFSALAIVLNLLSCPPIILLNALIITAVKTKRRLQTNHNILLASLAGTDFAVGIADQPVFTVEEIYRLTGGSPDVLCKIYSVADEATTCLCLVSLFHLVLISVERVVAMKYPLRYDSIVNKFRVTITAAGCWLLVMVYSITRIAPGIKSIPVFILVIVSLIVIPYCHIYVYSVCRRHMIQIKSEQVSQEASAKFLAERKAWKTTSIIIGGVFACYLPGVLRLLLRTLAHESSLIWGISTSVYPLVLSCFMLNSLCNPIIYCWRNKEIREVLKQLLRRQT